MKWLFVILSGLSLTSCISYPLMHYAVAQNVPLLTQQNEARLSASTGTEIIGLQGAWAFSKSFAVMGSYSIGLFEFEKSGFISDYSFNNGMRSSGELAIGYFDPIDENGVFEIYTGFERFYRSYSETQFPTGVQYTYKLSTGGSKPFVQFDLGFHNTDYHNFCLSFRMGIFSYDHFLYQVSDSGKTINIQTTNFNLTPSLIIEPCITYRLGMKNLCFQVQAGFSYVNQIGNGIPISNSVTDQFFFNVGLTYKLFPNWKARNSR